MYEVPLEYFYKTLYTIYEYTKGACMKKLYVMFVLLLVTVPLVAQKNQLSSNMESGVLVGASVGNLAAQQAQQQYRAQSALSGKRWKAQVQEGGYVNKQLSHPQKGNTYDLAITANAQDARKLTMNGREYRMAGVITTPVTQGSNILTNIYEDPKTKDQIKVQRLTGQVAANTWAKISSTNSSLERGYVLETKMPVRGKKNEWIISSSNGNKYNVRRYVKNEDGSITVLSANRTLITEGSYVKPDLIKRGTFQSVQNTNVAGFNENMVTTACKMGSDCY